MPRQAPLAASTVRAKGGDATVLSDTGKLVRSGYIVIRVSDEGAVVRYSIRRRGSYSGRTSREGEARGRDLRFRALKSGGFSRRISRDKVAGILRHGETVRGMPPRDYTDHGSAWRNQVSRQAMRDYLTAALRAGSLRMIRRLTRDVYEVVMAAGDV